MTRNLQTTSTVSNSKVKDLAQSEDRALDHYITNHPSGTVFHLTAWRNVVRKTFGHKAHYLVKKERGRILGVCPVFEIKSLLFGHYFISIPFAELGGVLADNDAIESELIRRACGLAESGGAQYLELRNRKRLTGFETKSLYYNFRKQILPDHDRNLKAIPRKSRAMVRNAIKKGLRSETGHHLLDDFYTILALNYHRLGTPVFPKKLFKNFLKEYKNNADILVVRTMEGALAAAVLFFVFNNQMIPYYAGSDFSFRRLGPNDFMYWELMKRGVEKNCTVFDYGRSKINTGSFRFKKHWGFEPEPLAYQYHLVTLNELPNLSPANPKYRKKIQMWQKMPHSLTKIIGPLIARNLG